MMMVMMAMLLLLLMVINDVVNTSWCLLARLSCPRWWRWPRRGDARGVEIAFDNVFLLLRTAITINICFRVTMVCQIISIFTSKWRKHRQTTLETSPENPHLPHISPHFSREIMWNHHVLPKLTLSKPPAPLGRAGEHWGGAAHAEVPAGEGQGRPGLRASARDSCDGWSHLSKILIYEDFCI